ncbi:MAG TPA: HDIG domain-containing protein [Patescibacteria group bacterium]|nr:HDIG domain-containing protein [Patescibacteria group bacterium]
MTREEALDLLYKNMQSPNLRRHCLAVEAVMRALAKRFDADVESWGIAGLLHDADYEKVKDTATKDHTKKVIEWLAEYDTGDDIKNAILAHGWGFVEGNLKPNNKMEWSLYCCDELTGFIVAVALTRPNKTLAEVTVESMQKKWKEKSFAGGVSREQVATCEDELNIPLEEFMDIALKAMQGISEELGL